MEDDGVPSIIFKYEMKYEVWGSSSFKYEVFAVLSVVSPNSNYSGDLGP